MKWNLCLTWVVCDKGYDGKRIADLCSENKLVPVIPKRKKPNGEEHKYHDFNKKRYKERNPIERCIGWLKENRRIATHYEKLADTYRGMIQLGAIRRTLRAARKLGTNPTTMASNVLWSFATGFISIMPVPFGLTMLATGVYSMIQRFIAEEPLSDLEQQQMLVSLVFMVKVVLVSLTSTVSAQIQRVRCSGVADFSPVEY